MRLHRVKHFAIATTNLQELKTGCARALRNVFRSQEELGTVGFKTAFVSFFLFGFLLAATDAGAQTVA
jgi:hypothetical protein